MAAQEIKYNTSFIPKKPVSSPSGSSFRKKGPGLMSIIGMFFFFLSILGVAGVIGWKIQTEKTIEWQQDQLRIARSQFDERTIAEATRLNQRINSVKTLLDNHVAPSNIFSLIESKILRTVSFNSLKYATNEDGTINITATGKAAGFESVVLQSDELGQSDFRDVIFSNVQPDDSGQTVGFSMNSSIEKNIVLYKNNIKPRGNDDLNVFDTEEESASENSDVTNILN